MYVLWYHYSFPFTSLLSLPLLPALLCSYASRLKLISEDFRAAIVELNSKGKAVIPENVIPHIFLNIRQIHTLSQQILSDLQKRMDNWKEIEEIGDVLSTLAPFLKVSVWRLGVILKCFILSLTWFHLCAYVKNNILMW